MTQEMLSPDGPKLPSPIEPLQCRNPDCTLPEGGRCARSAEFADPRAGCSDLLRVQGPGATRADEETVVQQTRLVVPPVPTVEASLEPDTAAAPWSGRHVNAAQADRLFWRSPARVIAVLGPYNAGKTSLLTSLFLQLANGQRSGFPYRFASSLTLHAFRALAERASRWSGAAEEEIVDHTPKEEGADPGSYLHLGLRRADPGDDRHIDLLLSDLPGEWASEWTEHANETSSRRMAFLQNCDGFLLVVDAAALLGPGGAHLDAATARLIRRLIDMDRSGERRHPLVLVFTKCDRILEQVEPAALEQHDRIEAWGPLGARSRRTRAALEEARAAGVDVALFPVSAFPHPMAKGQPIGVVAPFAFLMARADRRERWPRRVPRVPDNATSFQAMRRWEVET